MFFANGSFTALLNGILSDNASVMRAGCGGPDGDGWVGGWGQDFKPTMRLQVCI